MDAPTLIARAREFALVFLDHGEVSVMAAGKFSPGQEQILREMKSRKDEILDALREEERRLAPTAGVKAPHLARVEYR